MTALPPVDKAPFALRGGHVLAIVCAFFAVVIGVDGVFTYLALKTHPGEVSVTPYEDGLLYNRHLAQMAAQDRLGWRAAAVAEPNRVVIEFRDRSDRPVRGLAIAAKLERPATEAGRITPRFVETAPGRYEAELGAIHGGWDLTAKARDAQGDLFLAERRLTWR
jgi:nitrogen fixation protein FixH